MPVKGERGPPGLTRHPGPADTHNTRGLTEASGSASNTLDKVVSMLSDLLFKFGEASNKPPLRIRPGGMTVLVGPNNSGKSLTLREIQKFIGRPELHLGGDESGVLHVVASLCPEPPGPGKLRDHVLSEVELDIAPFRESLMAAPDLTPAALIEKFEPAHIMSIINELNRLGHLRKLAEQHKIDPSLLTLIDTGDLLGQPSLVALAIELLKQIVRYLQKHKETLENITRRHADSPALGLIEHRVVRMEGYVRHFAPFTVLLDGKNRLSLTDPQSISSLRGKPTGMMMRLFKNREEMEELRQIVLDAFGKHLVLDCTRMSMCHFVLADEPPEEFETSFTSRKALAYFKHATDILELSDGVKSYIGLHATLLSYDYRVILVDEPEAFLHPPLARTLGYNLTRLANKRGASVIAATHSPFFLMGCVEAQQELNIVRLGWRGDVATARALPAAELRKMMNDPLLRSTGVLSALFHQSAVVCEGDSDQAFYGEINERLRRVASGVMEGKRDEAYAKDCLFVNAHGKHSVSPLLGALRRMGVPSVGIVDLDVLRDKDGVAGDLARRGGAGPSGCLAIGQLRGGVYREFEEVAREKLVSEGRETTPTDKQIYARAAELIKRGGIDNLTKDKHIRDLRQFLNNLETYGIFVPERGELERWLPTLSGGLSKDGWLEAMFQKMGSLDDLSTYMEPNSGDVWDFVRRLAKWLTENAVNPPKEEFDGPPVDKSSTTKAPSVVAAVQVAAEPGGAPSLAPLGGVPRA
jgi:hypothetical protein